MGIFSKIFGKTKSPKEEPQHKNGEAKTIPIQTDKNVPVLKEIFEDPIHLSMYVEKMFILPTPIEKDWGFAPDEEAKTKLGIADADVERIVNEYSVLRVAGTVAWVKSSRDDEFYQSYVDVLAAKLSEHSSNTRIDEALNSYADFIVNKDDVGFSRLFFERVYPESDVTSEQLLAAGLGYHIIKLTLDYRDIFLDLWCQATNGMSLETYRRLYDAMGKVYGPGEKGRLDQPPSSN